MTENNKLVDIEGYREEIVQIDMREDEGGEN